MTVKELIKELKTLDQDEDITIYAEYGYGGGWDYANIQKIEKVEKSYNDKFYVIYHD